MTGTATGLLNVARSQIGYREGGRNATKYGAWYGLDHEPWCDIFASWCGAVAGSAGQVGTFAYTPAHANWFVATGRWSENPARGSLVFYAFGGGIVDHVGIVESWDRSTIMTIEGNTSSGAGSQSNGDGVYRRHRPRALSGHGGVVVGYGWPIFAPESGVRPASNHRPPPLIIDGIWGPATTRRLQQMLHVAKLSAKLDTATVRHIQNWSGAPIDGVMGRVTARHLQHKVGVHADGVIGPITVRALQRLINRT